MLPVFPLRPQWTALREMFYPTERASDSIEALRLAPSTLSRDEAWERLDAVGGYLPGDPPLGFKRRFRNRTQYDWGYIEVGPRAERPENVAALAAWCALGRSEIERAEHLAVQALGALPWTTKRTYTKPSTLVWELRTELPLAQSIETRVRNSTLNSITQWPGGVARLNFCAAFAACAEALERGAQMPKDFVAAYRHLRKTLEKLETPPVVLRAVRELVRMGVYVDGVSPQSLTLDPASATHEPE
jgi:hypothetical protein